MSRHKYRLHQAAKDLRVSNRYVAGILSSYGFVCKNHMQILDAEMLNLLFSYIFQHEEECIMQQIDVQIENARHAAVICWGSSGYYTLLIDDDAQIDREFLVDQCSNYGHYYADHEAAKNRAIYLSVQKGLSPGRIEEISIDDYPDQQTTELS